MSTIEILVKTPEVDNELARRLGGTGAPVLWESMTAEDLRATLQSTNVAVLPCGAVEQHGPHLPLGVDWRIAEHVALGVSALTGVPVAPTVRYGVSGSHGDFPGTLSVRSSTFIDVVVDVVGWMYQSGVRQVVLLNGHAWNSGALQVCAEEIRVRWDDIRVRPLGYSEMYPDSEIDGRVTYGRKLMHGNYFETSCMLHIAPELVNMERAVSNPDWDTFWDYRMDQVSDSGVWGRDIGEATAENGKREIERCIRTVAEALDRGRREPFGREA